jgi:LAO/AO transport system kinase
VADAADTVAVVIQPGSGDVLQFLKAGIMEVPDVLVVTKADLGRLAQRAIADLRAALRSLGARDTEVVAVSSVAPPSGIDELLDALDAHRDRLDLGARRLGARRAHALSEFAAEYGEHGLRSLGGRRQAQAWLAEQDPGLDVPTLVSELEERGRANRGS